MKARWIVALPAAFLMLGWCILAMGWWGVVPGVLAAAGIGYIVEEVADAIDRRQHYYEEW